MCCGDEVFFQSLFLQEMGCVNSKLVPEAPPPNAHLVETVYGHQDAKNKANRTPKLKQNQLHDGSIRDSQTIISTPQGQRTNKTVARYRDKFDPRVRAKYDIKALIGRGSFSRVVRVENRVTRQPYAIKMIDREHGKEVFESELSVLRRVRHKYIIQLVEVFETPGKVYMVMELATGGELFDRIIAKGSFTERDATRVLNMVVDGVQYLHALGITHRDLKPENLLYYHPGHDSKIMITDFGLSSIMKNGVENFMMTTCGTPEYIAPEMVARKPYGCQVDLWAVGVITYILVSGTMPFDEHNRSRLYKLILKANFSYVGEHWKDVSDSAKDFIGKLLVKEPHLRLTAAQCQQHPWLLTNAAGSANKNLHRTISQNLLQRQSTQNSAKSSKSGKSVKSIKSQGSLRSDPHRVLPEEIDALHRDPEVLADIASLGQEAC